MRPLQRHRDTSNCLHGRNVDFCGVNSRISERPRGSTFVMSGNGSSACPEEFIKTAQELADAAAEIIQQYFRYINYLKACMVGEMPNNL